MKVANMASYPPRGHVLGDQLERLSRQFDRINLCLNEFSDIPKELAKFDRLHVFIPDSDLKDVGKFVIPSDDEDIVFYIDDDILYPENYAAVMAARLERFGGAPVALGVHGVIYSDFLSAGPPARMVTSFRMGVEHDYVCSQLGTGTVAVIGRHAVRLEQMQGSTRYVDVRFAKICQENGVALVCVAREPGWLGELEEFVGNIDTIYHSFTRRPSDECLAEMKTIAGFARLDPNLAAQLREGGGFRELGPFTPQMELTA